MWDIYSCKFAVECDHKIPSDRDTWFGKRRRFMGVGIKMGRL